MNDDSAIRVLCLIIGGIVAVLALSMCSGCAFVHTYGTWAYEQAKVADDYLAQSSKVAICSLPEPAYFRNFREDELRGIALFCEDKLLLDYLEGLKRRAAEMKAACEPEVGP